MLVEIFHALGHQREVRRALRDLDAERAQIAREHADHARQGRLIIQDFKLQRLAGGIAHGAVAVDPAGLLQEFARLEQIGAQ